MSNTEVAAEKPVKAKKAAAPKEPKAPPVRNWVAPGPDLNGKKIYTSRGVGFIVKIDENEGRYLMADMAGVEHDVSASTARFTALDPKYVANRQRDGEVRTVTGAKAAHNGSPVALALRGLSIEQLASVASENGLDLGKWAGLNAGMQRMNLGNVLSNRYTKDPKSVKVLGESVEKAGESRAKEAGKAAAAQAKEAEAKAKAKAEAAKLAKAEKPAKEPKAAKPSKAAKSEAASAPVL